jgi:hypothetical protein
METLTRALEAGAAVGGVFLLLSIAGLFMVFGDGTASSFTHLMIFLNEVPFKLVGARRTSSMLFVAAAFWGLAAAVSLFLVLLLRDWLKRPTDNV